MFGSSCPAGLLVTLMLVPAAGTADAGQTTVPAVMNDTIMIARKKARIFFSLILISLFISRAGRFQNLKPALIRSSGSGFTGFKTCVELVTEFLEDVNRSYASQIWKGFPTLVDFEAYDRIAMREEEMWGGSNPSNGDDSSLLRIA
jgi:hypothetical protein